jgi:small subunit ribosomal protein S21
MKTLAKVTVQAGQSIEDALSKFTRQVKGSGILNEVRKREYYVKPGIQRKLKSKEAQKNKAKLNKKNY